MALGEAEDVLNSEILQLGVFERLRSEASSFIIRRTITSMSSSEIGCRSEYSRIASAMISLTGDAEGAPELEKFVLRFSRRSETCFCAI